MLYYLTGLTTERSALMAYHKLNDGIRELGETALAATVITPIRRQEPGHYAYYQMSAHALWRQLSVWQRWLVRRLRAITFVPVAASTAEHKADVGDMMISLGLSSPAEAAEFTEKIAHVERDLLWARDAGMRVPPYVAQAFAEAVELAQSRSRSDASRAERLVSGSNQIAADNSNQWNRAPSSSEGRPGTAQTDF